MRKQGSANQPSSDRDRSGTVPALLTALDEQLQASELNTNLLVDLLDSLCSKLRSHFLRPGRLEEAVFQAPWLTSFAEALRHEHRELLSSLETVREKVTRVADGSVDVTQVREAHNKFVKLLEKHDEGCRTLLYESQLCQGHLHH